MNTLEVLTLVLVIFAALAYPVTINYYDIRSAIIRHATVF